MRGTRQSEQLSDRELDRQGEIAERRPHPVPDIPPGEFRWKRYVATGLFDNDKKLKDYTEEEWDTPLYKTGFKPPNPTEEWPPTSYYEGIIPRLERTFLSKDSRDARTYRKLLIKWWLRPPARYAMAGD